MLYPKIKKKKQTLKMHMIDILDDIKIVIYKIIKIMINKEYFILFVKKSFHL